VKDKKRIIVKVPAIGTDVGSHGRSPRVTDKVE